MSAGLLEEIENWKLEAKLEDSVRYFYHTRVVDQILKGQKAYVIGRKGTGKTAISEHLVASSGGYFTQKLTFKNFPFNNLYKLKDKGFTPPNQYITLWKYVIYSSACRLMVEDQSVDPLTRGRLEKIFSDDIEHALPKAVDRWTGMKFDIKILGTGLGFGIDRDRAEEGEEWIRRVDVLESFLLQHIRNKYVILFDELDEDYKDVIAPEKHKQYTELLTGLFKAVQDVRSKFSGREFFPIIFLRDDIYEILLDPDKTKWSDFKVDLGWTEDSLKNLLAFRISRAISPIAQIMNFDAAWGCLFSGGGVRYGNLQKKNIHPFSYITRSSLLRPRDYIKYLQVCSTLAIERRNPKLSPVIVQAADVDFSNYLRSELEDEIHGLVPDIHAVLDLFTLMRKQTMRIDEFRNAFASAYRDGKVVTKDVNFVLEILFHFSVIGNQPKQQNAQVFRYKNRGANLNFGENIIIHRGLYRALQIF